MTLIKKIDVDKHLAARRAMRLGTIGPFGAAAIKSAPKSVPSSAETLSLEHSSPRVSSASIPITSNSGRNRLLRPPGSRHP